LRRLRAALGRFRGAASWPTGNGLRIDLVAVRPTADGRWRLAHHFSIDAW
jgi:hypothetical protein